MNTKAPTSVIEQAKTKSIQFVDTPYSVTYDKFGNAQVNLLPESTGPFVPLDGYREICVEVAPLPIPRGTGATTSFSLVMGKISGETVAEFIFNHQPTGAKIYCSSVKGPEALLWLHGTPNANDKVQLWVYLRS